MAGNALFDAPRSIGGIAPSCDLGRRVDGSGLIVLIRPGCAQTVSRGAVVVSVMQITDSRKVRGPAAERVGKCGGVGGEVSQGVGGCLRVLRRRLAAVAQVVTHHQASGSGEAFAERVRPGEHRCPRRRADEWCVVITEGFDAQGNPVHVDGGHWIGPSWFTPTPRWSLSRKRMRFTSVRRRGRRGAAASCRGGLARTAGNVCLRALAAGPPTSRRSTSPSCASVRLLRGRSARSNRRS